MLCLHSCDAIFKYVCWNHLFGFIGKKLTLAETQILHHILF